MRSLFVFGLLLAASNAHAGEGKTCLECDPGPAPTPPPPPPGGDGNTGNTGNTGQPASSDGDATDGDYDYDTSSSEPSIRDSHPEWNDWHDEDGDNGDTIRTIVHHRYAPWRSMRLAQPPSVLTPSTQPSEQEVAISNQDIEREAPRAWRTPLDLPTYSGPPAPLRPLSYDGGSLKMTGDLLGKGMPDERSQKDMGDVTSIVTAAVSGDLEGVDRAIKDAEGTLKYVFNPETVNMPRNADELVESVGAWLARVWHESTSKVGR